MNKIDEHPLPYISPSAVTFSSQVDDNEFKSKSKWDPNWTIQREISITIDKSVIDAEKCFPKKYQILSGIILIILFILSIILPLIIFIVDPYWPPYALRTTISTTINNTKQIESNSSVRNLDSCLNLLLIDNVNINGINILTNDSMTLSMCCSWCLKILSCHGFTYSIISSKCYLKSLINKNDETFTKEYKSGKKIFF